MNRMGVESAQDRIAPARRQPMCHLFILPYSFRCSSCRLAAHSLMHDVDTAQEKKTLLLHGSIRPFPSHLADVADSSTFVLQSTSSHIPLPHTVPSSPSVSLSPILLYHLSSCRPKAEVVRVLMPLPPPPLPLQLLPPLPPHPLLPPPLPLPPLILTRFVC